MQNSLEQSLTIEDPVSPSSFSFKDNGRVAAVGYTDGRIVLIDTDAKKEIGQFIMTND